MTRRRDTKPRPGDASAADSYATRAEALRQRVNASEQPSSWELELDRLAEYGDACRFAGRIEESAKTYDDLLEQATSHQHPRWICVARVGLGNALCARSQWDQAVDVLRPALRDADDAGDAVLRARAQCVLASALFNKGELDDSRRLLEGALRTAGEYDIPALKVPAMISLGIVALAQGNQAAASAHLDDGVRLARQVDDHHWAAMGRSYQAIHAHLGGGFERAAALYEQSLHELATLGIRRALGVCSFAQALLALARGRWSDAEERLHRANNDLSVTCPDYTPLIHSALALALLATGRFDHARQRITHARQQCTPCTPESFLWLVDRGEELLIHGAFTDDEPSSIEGRLFRIALRRVADVDHPPCLVVDEQAARARLLPQDVLVDLSRRAVLRLVLKALLRGHEQRPGEAVPEEELIAAGWPGEKIAPRPARVRLQTAVSTLRKKGLGSCLERSADGYRLRENLVVRVVASDCQDLEP